MGAILVLWLLGQTVKQQEPGAVLVYVHRKLVLETLWAELGSQFPCPVAYQFSSEGAFFMS